MFIRRLTLTRPIQVIIASIARKPRAQNRHTRGENIKTRSPVREGSSVIPEIARTDCDRGWGGGGGEAGGVEVAVSCCDDDGDAVADYGCDGCVDGAGVGTAKGHGEDGALLHAAGIGVVERWMGC